MDLVEALSYAPKEVDFNDEVDRVANGLLPYSTGFEIECDLKNGHTIEPFTTIDNIIEARGHHGEIRFRIPPGYKGLCCLYDISLLLPEHALLNYGSGIHYHIDATTWFENLDDEIVNVNKHWILNELDSWEYKGTYNSRDVKFARCWVRLHGHYHTVEIRIGEMTFDYSLLFKRIVHANDIVRRFKKQVDFAVIIKENPRLAYERDVNKTLKNRKTQI
jgi:hypothetical protein